MNSLINNKITTLKRHVVLVLIALVTMPLTSMAQDIFAKYEDNSDITYVNIKPKMFQILAKIDVNTDDPEAQDHVEMVKSITSLKAIVTENASISKDIATWVVDIKSKDLEELMEVKDNGTVVKFYVQEGKEENHVEELLIYVNGLSHQMDGSDTNINGKDRKFETVIVSLTGNIDLSKINFDLIGDQVQLKESSSNILEKESMIFKDLKIYPNPSNDVVTIDLPSAIENNINIAVIDTQGKQVKTQVLNTDNSNTLDVSNLQAGVYLIQISYDDSRIVKRFVKQ